MNPITEYFMEQLDIYGRTVENCWVEDSRDGKKIIKIKKDERVVYIGSKYNVERDMESFLTITQDINVNTIFIVFGIGTGEHIQRLKEKITDSNKIVVIEPSIEIMGEAYKSEYGELIFHSENIFVVNCDKDWIFQCLAKVVEDYNMNNIKLGSYANYAQLFPGEHEKMFEALNYFLQSETMVVATEIKYSEQFFKCFMGNLKHMYNSTPINELKDIYENVPAVIVSAGPSLAKNIHLLREVKGKFIIIAGGRTIKSIQRIGIQPDLIAVIDPSEACYKLVEDVDTCTAPLFFCEFTNHDVVDSLPGKKVFYQEGYVLGKVTPELIGQKVDTLFQGGSVAHTSVSIAKYIGCNPIIFIGQDFAYPGKKIHADMACYDGENEFKEDAIIVDDIHGNPVETDKVMNSYRLRMEMFIKGNPEIEFINCTEGGANIEGTTVMDFKQIIDRYRDFPPHGNKELAIIEKTTAKDDTLLKKNLKGYVSEMNSIQEECKKAVKYSEQILEHYTHNKQSDISKLLNKIKRLNDRIQGIEFLDMLLKPTTLRVMMHPEFMEKIGESQRDTGIRLAEQTKFLYGEIIKSIEDAKPIIEKSVG